jgi:hypothetical protein
MSVAEFERAAAIARGSEMKRRSALRAEAVARVQD